MPWEAPIASLASRMTRLEKSCKHLRAVLQVDIQKALFSCHCDPNRTNHNFLEQERSVECQWLIVNSNMKKRVIPDKVRMSDSRFRPQTVLPSTHLPFLVSKIFVRSHRAYIVLISGI